MILEPFSDRTIKAITQARDIYRLTEQEKGWLEDIYPEKIANYGNIPQGAKRVGRLAADQYLSAFIVREREAGVARGLATIIFDQVIIHPTEGPFAGHDLDYWLDLEAEGSDLHLGTVEELVSTGVRMSEVRHLGDKRQTTPMMATVAQDIQNPSVGFEQHPGFVAVGRPAVLETDPLEDPYGLAKNGAVLQLYMKTVRKRR